ncbi:MAG TPA: tetratricopeptide repeat protein [Pyrinomonadaceae bacterium]|nr:tetratricopeptide repeat protein [Pyrinomonadaceae bacterium]
MYKSLLLIALLLSANSLSVIGQTANKNATQSNQTPLSNDQLTPNPSSDNGLTAQDFYKEGLRLTDEGQLLEAVQQFQQAVKIDPEYAEAHAALGRAYFKLRQWQNAVDSLHRASALKSRQRLSQESSKSNEKRNSDAEAMPLKPLPLSAPLRSEPAKNESVGPSTTVAPIQTNRSAQTNTTFAAAKPSVPRPEPTLEEQKLLIIVPIPPRVPIQSKVSEKTNDVVAQTSAGIKNQQIDPNTTLDSGDKVAQGKAGEPRNSEVPKDLNLQTAKEPVPEQNKASSTSLTSSETAVPALKSVTAEPATINLSNPTANTPTPSATPDAVPVESPVEATGAQVAMSVTPASTPLETKPVAPIPTRISGDELLLTKIYRIGPGDVLDVRTNDSDPTRSTLFTVTAAGFLEHPLLAEPLLVTGLTTEEIGSRVEAGLTKNASGEDSRVEVGVRDYASHSILVSGLVKDPGTKFLRREAIPLYVVVADAQPSPQAARVTVVRNEVGQIFDIDLTQAAEMNMMVHPGDVITLQPNVTQYYYIDGEVKFPGEKTFRRGLTLTQAIITAGGSTGKSKTAKIARDDGQGFLVDTIIDLNEIQFGKAIDPPLKAGDRITILR